MDNEYRTIYKQFEKNFREEAEAFILIICCLVKKIAGYGRIHRNRTVIGILRTLVPEHGII